MPRFDGTGPEGMGPMTGRGFGPCGGGRGFGRRGLGKGFGRRCFGFYPNNQNPIDEEERKKLVEEEIKYTEEYIQELKKQLK